MNTQETGLEMEPQESLLQNNTVGDSIIDSLNVYTSRQLKRGKINDELEKQINCKKDYWVEVLRRIISVIKFLASRELVFRGTDERFGEKRNGNYLGLLELLAEYDPFLKDHINRMANLGKGKTSYLFKDICNEVLTIMANRVIEEIAKQIKANKYFSVSVNSTPDISHQDQLTIILRYCNSKGLPFERFIVFYDNIGHGAQELEQCVMDMLKTFNLDIQNCRGQSYDNASNMSGRFSGLQARIKAHNELAICVACAGHSLNLVVQNAADCCFEATPFFMLVQAFYTFFSASTHRWNLLSSTIRDSSGSEKSLMPKRVNTTRWSSRFDAIKALQSSYNSIKTCLNNIATDVNEKNIVRVEASSLCEKLNFLENGIVLVGYFAKG
ncbi:zinc finger MYM-type protein 1-like [Anthonomus grandis grandis]|uniref:zinc finger MYM-type protein 1-like n=1 Tax=Anthonomus grandis grandis TaxID=2921223 RepID=UPI0021669B52|nr:zinc finger MYM-type protein 1-like [Anthonomus grandis grandis]